MRPNLVLACVRFHGCGAFFRFSSILRAFRISNRTLCADSRDENITGIMSAGTPDDSGPGGKRKRPAKDWEASQFVSPSPGEPEGTPEAAASAGSGLDTMASGGLVGRRKRILPKVQAPEDIDPSLGEDVGTTEDEDSPDKRSSKYSAGGKWTKYEDECLRQGVEEVGAKNWKAISVHYLKGKRTDVQCLHRWQKVSLPHGARIRASGFS